MANGRVRRVRFGHGRVMVRLGSGLVRRGHTRRVLKMLWVLRRMLGMARMRLGMLRWGRGDGGRWDTTPGRRRVVPATRVLDASRAIGGGALLARGRKVEILDGGQANAVWDGVGEVGVLRLVGGHGGGGRCETRGARAVVYLLYLPIRPDLVENRKEPNGEESLARAKEK